MREDFPFQKAEEAIVDMLHDYLVEKEHAERLEAENARLKAEVERLTAKQADIDRVQAQSDFYRSKLIEKTEYAQNIQLLDQVNHLEVQVKRLTKAGDAMAAHIERNDERCYIVLPDGDIRISEWNAAKEGNGQP